MSWTYEKIDKCSYCSEPAVYLFSHSGLFTRNTRLLCEDCRLAHNRVRDDVRGNHL